MTRPLQPRRDAGFSLMEMILAVIVLSSLMLAVFNLLQSYAVKEQAAATREYMSAVADATQEILSNADNFNALYNAARATGGGYQLIADTSAAAPDNITRDFTVGATVIQAARSLNASFRPTAPLRSQVRILLRIADNPAIATDTPALDILVVTTTPLPDDMVMIAARSSGAAGGWVRTYGNKAAAIIQSAYNSWNIPVSSGSGQGVQATSWYASNLPNSLDSKTQGSFFVMYRYANLQNQVGDYLYRRPDTALGGQRNTMYGPLSLGGHALNGADDVGVGGTPFVTADSVSDDCAGDVLCVNGTGISGGTVQVDGQMTVTGSAFIADSTNVKTTRIQNGLNPAQRSAYQATGQMVVDGLGSTGDQVSVTGDATFQDGVSGTAGSLGAISAKTTVIPTGQLTTGTINNTKRITSSNISSNRLNVTNRLKVGVINNGDVTVNNGGNAGVIDIRNSNTLTYGDEGGSQRTLRVPAANIGTMSINSFGTCDNGCGN